MHIVSANVSGLRAAIKDGLFSWPHIAGDILCLQETAADGVEAIGQKLGFYTAAADTIRETNQRKAHGGVAILSRKPVTSVTPSVGHLATRGQFVACSIGSLRIASVYVTLDAHPQQFRELSEHFATILKESPYALIAGDFNVFRGHQDSWRFHDAVSRNEVGTDAGARTWLDAIFSQGWVDVMRIHSKKRPF